MAPASPAPIIAVGIDAPAAELEEEAALDEVAAAAEPETVEPVAVLLPEAAEDVAAPATTVVAPLVVMVCEPVADATPEEVPLRWIEEVPKMPDEPATVRLPLGRITTVALAVVATATWEVVWEPVALATAELSAALLVAYGTRYVLMSEGRAVNQVGV